VVSPGAETPETTLSFQWVSLALIAPEIYGLLAVGTVANVYEQAKVFDFKPAIMERNRADCGKGVQFLIESHTADA
jgi:hypothetical protein